MTLRHYVAAAVFLALGALPLAAQHDDHASHAAARPVLEGDLAEHFKGITLTDAQVQRVKEIQARAHAAMDSLRRATPDQNDPTLKAALARLMSAEHREFKAVLTPEQAVVFEANMKAHHEAEMQARPAPPATPTPAPTRRPEETGAAV